MRSFLIVDDHSIVRTGIKLILLRLFPTAIIREAVNEKTCYAVLSEAKFDMVLIDLNMPESDPTAMIYYIQRKYPLCNIAILTMNEEKLFAKRFFKLGIKGYLNKAVDDKEIEKAIQLIVSGGIYVSDKLKNTLAESLLPGNKDNPFESLSDREFQVAQELIKGKSISEISYELNLHASTVSTYKAKIFEKMKIQNNNILELYSLAQTYNIV